MDLIKKLPEHLQGKAGTVVEALLGVIPFAGGSLATVFGNYIADKKVEKITEAIDELANKVKVNDIVIDKLLTEGQACELLEIHLGEIARTSDEEKTRFLKNSLNNSFTNSDLLFEDKELYMLTLKGLSVTEIFMLKELYQRDDPFVSKIYPHEPQPSNIYGEVQRLKILNPNLGFATVQPEYAIDSSSYIEGMQTLENYYEKKFEKKWPFLKGGCHLLDSKGLTNLKDNFENKIRKEIKMKRTDINPLQLGNVGYISSIIHDPTRVQHIMAPLNSKTPYEGSRTEFGEAFMKYVTN